MSAALLMCGKNQMNGKPTPLYLYAFLIVFLVFAVIFRSARAGLPARNTSVPPQQSEPTTSKPTISEPRVIQPTAIQPTAIQPTAIQPTAIQPTAIQPTALQRPTLQAIATQQELLAKYGEVVYPDLQSMPTDLRQYYLYWVFKAQAAYGVPAEDILSVHFAEQMGAGLRPLETRTSSAGAVGPGQITPGYWNGWAAGSPRSYFLTDVQTIQSFGGCGVDFDGNGTADPRSLPDNVAATACGLARDHVQLGLRDSNQQHAAVLAEALCIYNSGKSCVYALPATRQYMEYGINWMLSNLGTVQALASSYTR